MSKLIPLHGVVAAAMMAVCAQGLSQGHRHKFEGNMTELSHVGDFEQPRGIDFDIWAPSMLAVPRLKLLFCFIPKNACTQFNLLMNSLNGIDKLGHVCTRNDPNWRSQWAGQLGTKDQHRLESLLEDPTWTKGVFLRDPFERLVSGWRSECEPPQECGGCMNFPHVNGKSFPSFEQFVSKLDQGSNIHFNPQSEICGGFSPDSIKKYDYVGRVTNDYGSVARQVEEMMLMAVNRSQSTGGLLGKDFVMSRVHQYFPPSGPTAGAAHTHHTQDVASWYQHDDTRDIARRHYAKDFELLDSLAADSSA